jgi:hypothetical protein
MRAARICLVMAAILALNACAGRRHISSSPPTETSASDEAQPAITSAEPATSQPTRAAAPEPSVTTPAPQAEIKASPPVASEAQPAITSEAPATSRPARAAAPKPSVTTPAPQAKVKAAPPVASTPAPIAQAPKPAAPPRASPTLDLNALKTQLKETKAIGLFTKIALKNQVDDLLDQFRKYYQGKAKIDMAELRRSYNLLMMKVLSLLQDKDPKLASAIVSSREAIWGLLSDPKKFANLEI